MCDPAHRRELGLTVRATGEVIRIDLVGIGDGGSAVAAHSVPDVFSMHVRSAGIARETRARSVSFRKRVMRAMSS